MSSDPKIVVGIIVAFIVAGGAFVAHIASREAQTVGRIVCTANLKQLTGAKYIWAQEHAKTTNDVPSDSELFGPKAYINEEPLCPLRGTYTLGKVSEPVQCSIPTHTLSDPKLRR